VVGRQQAQGQQVGRHNLALALSHSQLRSYGFWITALNKAGNYKRGKRSAFMPAMGALVDDHNPLTGPSDYSDVAELVPDQKPQ